MHDWAFVGAGGQYHRVQPAELARTLVAEVERLAGCQPSARIGV
jgi:hypothetical protein